jgi:glutamine synthetase
MADMTKGKIIPACIAYQNELAKLLERKKACGNLDVSLESHLLGSIAKLSSGLLEKLTILEKAINESKEKLDIHTQARFYRDSIVNAMSELRIVIDELETLTARKHWPLPVYSELLYSII